MKYFIYGVIGVVAAMIVLGFYVVGSPRTERMRQFDERRVNDLSALQYNIINYWQVKGKLPASLGALAGLRGGSLYTDSGYLDPETNAPYEYAIKGEMTFDLCANFALASEETAPSAVAVPRAPVEYYGKDPNLLSNQWQHGAVRTCFTRTIDPDLYPPAKK